MSKEVFRVFKKYNHYRPERKGNREDTVKIGALNNCPNLEKLLKELDEALKKSKP